MITGLSAHIACRCWRYCPAAGPCERLPRSACGGQRTPRSRRPAATSRPGPTRRESLKQQNGFVDLGNGTQVRIGGRVRMDSRHPSLVFWASLPQGTPPHDTHWLSKFGCVVEAAMFLRNFRRLALALRSVRACRRLPRSNAGSSDRRSGRGILHHLPHHARCVRLCGDVGRL